MVILQVIILVQSGENVGPSVCVISLLAQNIPTCVAYWSNYIAPTTVIQHARSQPLIRT